MPMSKVMGGWKEGKGGRKEREEGRKERRKQASESMPCLWVCVVHESCSTDLLLLLLLTVGGRDDPSHVALDGGENVLELVLSHGTFHHLLL